tara:strand:- start:68 stop:1630 length:1563 start_codon:yes stop_codon:yes gene_type:complete
MTKARDISSLIDNTGQIDNNKITLDANEIPGLDASKIVSGDIAASRLSLATETKPVVSSVSPNVISNNATDITITGTDFISIPRVDLINTATGIWYSVNTVTFNSTTSLTANITLPVDGNTYRIRVENPDGLAGLSSANFLTVSDAPVWTTSAGSLGTVAGNFNGTVATVAATGDSITYSETTNVLTNSSLANCSLDPSTGVITSTDFDGSSTSPRTHTFTIRATDAQGQTTDREFNLTSSYSYSVDFLVLGGGGGSGYQNYYGGGGGAGGLRTSYGSVSGGGSSAESSITFSGGITYTITVGQGGVGAGNSTSTVPQNGGNSSISGSGLTTITSLGGGRGAYGNTGYLAGTGGSGGGGSGDTGGTSYQNGAYGTSNQGSSGGDGDIGNGGNGLAAGGGGGSATAGANTSPGSGRGGKGGNGTSISITGSAITYGAGGAGARGYYGSADTDPNGDGWSNTNNRGHGGSGIFGESTNGKSGVVILRMPTSNYSGSTTGSPTVSQSGSDTIVIFTADGSYTS